MTELSLNFLRYNTYVMEKQKAKTTKLYSVTKDPQKHGKAKSRLPEIHEIEFDDVVHIHIGNKNVKKMIQKI